MEEDLTQALLRDDDDGKRVAPVNASEVSEVPMSEVGGKEETPVEFKLMQAEQQVFMYKREISRMNTE